MADGNEGIITQTKTVTTKKGEITIREICIEDLQVVGAELGTLAALIPQDRLEGANTLALVKTVLMDKELMPSIKRILAQMTDTELTFWDKMPVTDLIGCGKAFTEVNDMKELRDYFLVFRGMLVPEKAEADAEGSQVGQGV